MVTLDHYGANGMGGHSAQVSAPVMVPYREVLALVEKKSGLRGWIPNKPAPVRTKGGRFVWIFSRSGKTAESL